MKARMGAARAIGLGAATALVAAGVGVVTPTPAAHADPVLPGPTSDSWMPLKKSGAVATDPTNDQSVASSNLTPAGGALGTSTAYVTADLQYVYFRFHVAEAPTADTTAGFVVQFDTDGDPTGWESALRLDLPAKTVTLFTADANSGVKATGTSSGTIAATQVGATTYPGADGGAFVAFAVPQTRLPDTLKLGGTMVLGATSQPGAGLDAKKPFLGQAPADVLGTGNFGGLSGNPAWDTLMTDPFLIDIDGDGIPDQDDNCQRVANPDQADDDAAVDFTLPPGSVGQPDGTEGKGNACDETPRGYDVDGDDVGLMDDACPEQYGLLANGCVAQSTTTAILRYKARTKTFSGLIGADYDQCLPKRRVAVYRQVKGPDVQLGAVRTDGTGHYKLVVTKRPRAGTYYSSVDPKWTLGARCFAVKSAKLKVG